MILLIDSDFFYLIKFTFFEKKIQINKTKK